MGAGGAGRHVRITPPGQSGNDDLYWTQQEIIEGGHNVPLSSLSDFLYLCHFLITR
jgi:saccharopepsin